MPVETLWLRKAVVLGSALIYWAGVFMEARRVRKQIGRSPNLKPRGSKERLLWAGWLFVILGWVGQPFLLGGYPAPLFSLIPFLAHPIVMLLGILLVVGSYGGTLWCYAALGDAWRMGINKREKTLLVKTGPYQSVRHPIYLFQIIMLTGTLLLLPTPFSVILLGVHFLCVLIKALDEEAYLIGVHGPEYRDYVSRTGRFLPKLRTIDPS